MDINSKNIKAVGAVPEMFDLARLEVRCNAPDVILTPELRLIKNNRYRVLKAADIECTFGVDEKFFKYFKSAAVKYKYFKHKGGYVVFAYNSTSNEVLGISITRPIRYPE